LALNGTKGPREKNLLAKPRTWDVAGQRSTNKNDVSEKKNRRSLKNNGPVDLEKKGGTDR